MTTARVLELEVEVATLRRRMDSLEAKFLGAVDDLQGPQPLFAVYSHLLLDGIQPGAEAAALLSSCALLLNPRNLLDLGRMTADPFPWRPFLTALDLLEVTGHDVHDAVLWVQGCAEELLAAQGLGILRVEDVLRSPVGPLSELKRFALSER